MAARQVEGMRKEAVEAQGEAVSASQAIVWGGWGQSRESLALVLCVPAATRHRVTAWAGFIGASAVKLLEYAVRNAL
jgi:hypothetical protein